MITLNHRLELDKWVISNYSTLDSVYHTYSSVARVVAELWPMIDSVMPSCCSRMTAAVATRYTTPDTRVEIGTVSETEKYLQ